MTNTTISTPKSDATLIAGVRELTAITDAALPAYMGLEGKPEAVVYAAAFGRLSFAARELAAMVEDRERRIASLQDQLVALQAELDARHDDTCPYAEPVTGRDVLLTSMGTGNVNHDDEESLQFADESEYIDD